MLIKQLIASYIRYIYSDIHIHKLYNTCFLRKYLLLNINNMDINPYIRQ